MPETTPAGPPHGPSHDPGIEARVSALESDARDIKELLGQLEPVLSEMEDRIRRIEAEALPSLATEIAKLTDRVSPRPTAVQVLGSIGGLLALVIVLCGLGLAVARFGMR